MAKKILYKNASFFIHGAAVVAVVDSYDQNKKNCCNFPLPIQFLCV